MNEWPVLENVVHVTKLCTNTKLLLIETLTTDCNRNGTFYPSHCVLQMQGTKRMIGHAKERDGLYFLEVIIVHIKLNYKGINVFWVKFRKPRPMHDSSPFSAWFVNKNLGVKLFFYQLTSEIIFTWFNIILCIPQHSMHLFCQTKSNYFLQMLF